MQLSIIDNHNNTLVTMFIKMSLLFLSLPLLFEVTPSTSDLIYWIININRDILTTYSAFNVFNLINSKIIHHVTILVLSFGSSCTSGPKPCLAM